ncbi:Retrovirus-related Pol polyprotein from transposon TNT 1-94 [Eumeta japonica]|uniref:Retrovirus-related Pol polyprotein from transposon TNT 1-94 n=1 Tax=Eumeta variegata TaxID=151549 RepID=A0A4C1XAK2_EUMVA|nr:Retrovirus-related Pol polyprotein from transposon TNT 1-94 [Eumeta japonica]
MSEGGDVRDHVNKFSDIVDRLGAMDIQVNKDLLSIMLLFSLPDSYEGFKCAIESRDELLRRNGPDKQNKQYRQEKQCAQADDDTFAVYNTEFASIIPSSRPWILDSGCTTHLCGDKQLFKSFNEETNGRINLASQASSEIKGKGTVNLLVSNGKQLRSVGFSNTLFVPDLRSNLVSVAKITNKDCEVLFRKDSAMIMDSTGNIKFVAERRGDLYYLQEGNEEADIVEDKTNSEFLMWHCRMGHLNANDLVRVINQNTTTSERQSEETLEIVHTDIVGPFKTQSVNGARYFITFIDDRSRWCEVYFLKQKSGALEAFKMYQTQAERVTGKKIKYLQSDNGKEYCNAEMDNFLRNQGIQRRLSVVRTPQQNGVAERFNRTIVEMARCLLLQSSLSDMFWADAVATACHLRNRCPSRSINGDTPYQRWFNRDKMSLNYLRAFGSTVYVLDKNPAKGKLSDRSMKGIFVGYPRETKGYRIWLSESRKFIVARDVKFIEDNVTTILKNQKIEQLIINDYENENKPWVELITGFGNNNEIEAQAEIPGDLEDNEENEKSSGVQSSIHETPRRESREEAKEEKRGPGRPKLIKTGLRGRPRKLFSKVNNCEVQERIDCNFNEDNNIFVGITEVQLDDAMNSQESTDWKRAIQSEVMSLLKK